MNPLEIRLWKGQEIKLYTPFGGGVQLHFEVKDDGLYISYIGDNLKIKTTKTKYSTEWHLSHEDEGGYDRT